MRVRGARRRFRPGSRGVALLAVLWVTTLLAAIAVSFVGSIRTETTVTRNLVDSAKAQALADAGVYRAIVALYQGFEEVPSVAGAAELALPDTGTQDEAAASAAALASAGPLKADGRPYLWAFEGSTLKITVQSEAGKIDLNAGRNELLIALMQANGVELGDAETLMDRIDDFRDADSDRHPRGAEDEDYDAAGLKRGAKDAPFATIEELQQVLGMSRELYDRLAPAVTVYSEARGIDPLTAPPAALRALPGMDQETLDALLAERLAEDPDLSPFLSGFEAFLAGPAGLAYTIHSEAATADGTRFLREAVVALVPGSGRPFRLFVWRRGRLPEPRQDTAARTD